MLQLRDKHDKLPTIISNITIEVVYKKMVQVYEFFLC
jgi:hypothetical protein